MLPPSIPPFEPQWRRRLWSFTVKICNLYSLALWREKGEGEREGETKNVPFKKPQSLTLSARASFCDSAAASQWASFHCGCARITFLAAAQVRAFFVPVRRPSPRHISMGPYRVCLEQIRPGNGLPSSEREFAAAH